MNTGVTACQYRKYWPGGSFDVLRHRAISIGYYPPASGGIVFTGETRGREELENLRTSPYGRMTGTG